MAAAGYHISDRKEQACLSAIPHAAFNSRANVLRLPVVPSSDSFKNVKQQKVNIILLG